MSELALYQYGKNLTAILHYTGRLHSLFIHMQCCASLAASKNMIKKAYLKVHGSANYKTMQVCYSGDENFTQPLISKEYEILI